jgi:hypothetical protein
VVVSDRGRDRRLRKYLGGHAHHPLRSKPRFATDIVANIANNATTIPDGIVVLLPETSKLWRSGPKAAETATASQMETITRDAHISRASIQVGLRTTVEGSCETVDITASFVVPMLAPRQRPVIGGNPDCAFL